MKTKHEIKKNRGQVTVEYILLAVALIVLFQIATTQMRTKEYLKNFQGKPKAVLVNLMENGNLKFDKDKSRQAHPNDFNSHYTPRGKGPCTRDPNNPVAYRNCP